MAQFLMVTVTLGCISLLYLLPGTQSGGLGKGLKLLRPRSRGPQSLCDLETFAQSGADNGTCDLGYVDGPAAKTPQQRLHPVTYSLDTLPSGLQPGSLFVLPQPQGRGNPTLAMVHLLQNGGSRHPGPQRHLGPRRPHAQLLRVGCVLGTCQVQNLSHRLWQLVRPAGQRDSAPIDPSSPHSYG